jgi:hypothetical protein
VPDAQLTKPMEQVFGQVHQWILRSSRGCVTTPRALRDSQR